MTSASSARIHIACPYCNADSASHWADNNGYKAVQCGECNFVYVCPRPAPELVSAAVETGIHLDLGGHNVITKRHHSKVALLRKSLEWSHSDIWSRSTPLTWMDMGSGFGETIEAIISLAPAGSRVVGAEPMKPKADDAIARGVETYNCYPQDVPETFDFVSLVQVFSHIPDFRSFLASVKPRLNPGAEIYIVTGNAAEIKDARHVPGELDLPDHLVFAGRKHLHGFLEEAGFEILFTKEQRMDTWIWFVKNCIKVAIGRQAQVVIPGTTAFRDLHIRARLKK